MVPLMMVEILSLLAGTVRLLDAGEPRAALNTLPKLHRGYH